jgi:hypothetical protein
VILHAVGGLANRLRAILSYRAAYGPITVVWDVNEYVSHGRWDDVFLPLEGVSFDYRAGWTSQFNHHSLNREWDAEDFAPCKDAPAEWERAYREVRPEPSIVGARIEIMSAGPPYSAIHVRRTDYVPNTEAHAGRVEPLEDYVLWAENHGRTCFVASDNGETQDFLMKRLLFLGAGSFSSCSLPGSESQGLTDHHRNGTLADAVVDLFVCSRAAAFKGSVGSSFTDTIEILKVVARAEEKVATRWAPR